MAHSSQLPALRHSATSLPFGVGAGRLPRGAAGLGAAGEHAMRNLKIGRELECGVPGRLGVWLTVLGCGASVACGGTIDFETIATGSYNVGTPLSISNVLGSGETADFVSPPTIGVASWPAFVVGRPASWGNRGLAVQSFVLNFSGPAFKGVEIEFGFLGAGPSAGTGTAELRAFSGLNGTGSLLGGSGLVAFSGNLGLGQSSSLAFDGGAGFGSIVFSSDFGGTFWDNLSLVPVPLPGAGGMALAGLGLGAMRRRRSPVM